MDINFKELMEKELTNQEKAIYYKELADIAKENNDLENYQKFLDYANYYLEIMENENDN